MSKSKGKKENYEHYKKILYKIFEEAKEIYGKKDNSIFKELTEENIEWLKVIVNNVENQKSIIAVLITSLLKKVVSPNQDIRLHRKEFKGGYSGRSLDTHVTTPWLKHHFPKFAPKESGWLTRSIEQPHPFNKEFPGKIRNEKVKEAFLSILDSIESESTKEYGAKKARIYLLKIFFLLLEKVEKYKQELEFHSEFKSTAITIYVVLNMLMKHFSMEQSSRLPVIAIYTLYQIFRSNIKRYRGKILKPLKPHTTSDKYSGFGDIEVYNQDGTPFEIVEIKHNIPIDKTIIEDVLRKIKNTKTIERYYILTTAEPNFEESQEEEIFKQVQEIKSEYGFEIVPNGIYNSLKYYLRFVPDLSSFLELYEKNLKEEFYRTTDVKEFHIKGWRDIKEKFLR